MSTPPQILGIMVTAALFLRALLLVGGALAALLGGSYTPRHRQWIIRAGTALSSSRPSPPPRSTCPVPPNAPSTAATAGVTAREDSMGVAVVSFLPTLAATVLLALSTVVAYPFEMDTIVALARDRLVATHYGLYNTFAGIGITVGNLGIGAIWGLAQRWDLPALPWLVLAATGAACTAAVARLAHARRLEPLSEPVAAPADTVVPQAARSR